VASPNQQSTAPSHYPPPRSRVARLVVLVSGSGTNLQALLDAAAAPAYGAAVVAVGADRDGILALKRAEDAGVPTFVCRVKDHPDRAAWDRALRDEVRRHEPDLVVLAGFMKLVGTHFLAEFGGRIVNTHPALLPSFPGMHGARDALAYGVKVTGCTLFLVDAGVDDGPIIAQAAVPVEDGDDEESLHERIKVAERELLVDRVGRMIREGWTVLPAPAATQAAPLAASAASPTSPSSPSIPGGTAPGTSGPAGNRKVTIP
jgi:phosphoribosylglycinamide formyltransferase-1